jgi:hypothetical protein
MTHRPHHAGPPSRIGAMTINTRARHLVAGLLACAVALSVTASAAIADVDTTVPGGLGVMTTQAKNPALAGAGALTSSFSYKIRTCDTPFIPVQSGPSGYVLGNCTQGTQFLPQDTSTVGQDLYYGGLVLGNYSACGWINGTTSATQLDGGAVCPVGSIGYNLSEFAMATNASAASAPGNDCNKSPVSGACTDGSTTSLKLACPFYGNFRPWASGQQPTDPITNAQHPVLPVGTIIKWRYAAKYPSSSGNYYVMVKLANSYLIPIGYGNWGFINASCINGLPYFTAV